MKCDVYYISDGMFNLEIKDDLIITNVSKYIT